MEDQLGWKGRFRDILALRGLTMKEVSLKAGQGATYVRDVLERQRTPSVDNFVALARALDVDPSYLLTGREGGVSTAPIRGEGEILSVLERIEGLSQTDVEVAFAVIANAISVNKAGRSQSSGGDQSASSSPHRESTPSR